jgi:hypothetical protein
LCRVKVIRFQSIVAREGMHQNEIGRIRNPIKDLDQLMESDKRDDVGSKVENRFVIIFS